MQNYAYPNASYMYAPPPQQQQQPQQHYGAIPVNSRSHSSRYDPASHPQGPPYPLAGNGPPVIPPQPPNGLAPRPWQLTDRSASDPTKKPLKSAMKKPTSSGSAPSVPLPARASGKLMQRSRTVPATSGDPDIYRGRTMETKAPELSRGHSASGTERSSLRAASLSRHRSLSRSRRGNYTPGACHSRHQLHRTLKCST